MLKIGNIELKSNIISGPMAGITNPAFNSIISEFGAGLVVNEMISDKAICYKNKKTLKMLVDPYNIHPIAYQLFGGEVSSMVKAAKYIDENSNCDIIDINMGCPVNKVLKAGAGSKLLLNPQLAYEIVSNVVKNVSKPVTVKLRLGFDKEHINIVEMAKLMEQAGASAITIHCRTRDQFYSGKVDWSYLKLVKEAVSIPVIGNGDVIDEKMAKEMIEECGVDGVMIARASVGNPWIFMNSNRYINNLPIIEVSKEDKINICLEHTKRLIDLEGDELIAIKQMRGIVGHYIKGFENASKVRTELNNIKTYKELENILNYVLSEK